MEIFWRAEFILAWVVPHLSDNGSDQVGTCLSKNASNFIKKTAMQKITSHNCKPVKTRRATIPAGFASRSFALPSEKKLVFLKRVDAVYCIYILPTSFSFNDLNPTLMTLQSLMSLVALIFDFHHSCVIVFIFSTPRLKVVSNGRNMFTEEILAIFDIFKPPGLDN